MLHDNEHICSKCNVMYPTLIVVATCLLCLPMRGFEVDAKEGRLTLERSSVAVEVVSTTGEGRADGDTVTGGKVQSEERSTIENNKARSEVPDTTSSLCTTAEKAATMGSQTNEVEMGKRSTEEATVLGGNVSNRAAAATEERKACEDLHQGTTEEAPKIGNHGNHLHDSADVSQPSPLSINGTVLSFMTCKLPS